MNSLFHSPNSSLSFKHPTPNFAPLHFLRSPNHLRFRSPNLRPHPIVACSSKTPPPENEPKININNNVAKNTKGGEEDQTKAIIKAVLADLLLEAAYFLYVKSCVAVFTKYIPGVIMSLPQLQSLKMVNEPPSSLIKRIRAVITPRKVTRLLAKIRKVIGILETLIRVIPRLVGMYYVALNIFKTTVKFFMILGALVGLYIAQKLVGILEDYLKKEK